MFRLGIALVIHGWHGIVTFFSDFSGHDKSRGFLVAFFALPFPMDGWKLPPNLWRLQHRGGVLTPSVAGWINVSIGFLKSRRQVFGRFSSTFLAVFFGGHRSLTSFTRGDGPQSGKHLSFHLWQVALAYWSGSSKAVSSSNLEADLWRSMGGLQDDFFWIFGMGKMSEPNLFCRKILKNPVKFIYMIYDISLIIYIIIYDICLWSSIGMYHSLTEFQRNSQIAYLSFHKNTPDWIRNYQAGMRSQSGYRPTRSEWWEQLWQTSIFQKEAAKKCMDLYKKCPENSGMKDDTSTEHYGSEGILKTYPKKRSSKIWWLPPYQLCCDFWVRWRKQRSRKR